MEQDPPPDAPPAPLPQMDVYLDGDMLPPDRARVRLDDAGFQHAVGLFETFGVYHGKPFRLSAHLDRLAASAAQLGLARELDTDALARAVTRTIQHNALRVARVRLTVTAGPVSLLAAKATGGGDRSGDGDGEAPSPPGLTVAVVPSPPTQYDPQYFQRGITAVIAPAGANPFDALAGHKTLAYWGRLRTLRQAAAAGAGEAIWLNVSNHLAGGAVSNLLLVKGGELLTPFARGEELEDALPAPVRPGVIRAAVLEAARSLGIPVHRRMLSVGDLLDADEALLTNSSWLILPVTRVEQKPIGAGRVGPVTAKLRQALLDVLVRETGG